MAELRTNLQVKFLLHDGLALAEWDGCQRVGGRRLATATYCSGATP